MCHTRLGDGRGGGIRWSYTIFSVTYSEEYQGRDLSRKTILLWQRECSDITTTLSVIF